MKNKEKELLESRLSFIREKPTGEVIIELIDCRTSKHSARRDYYFAALEKGIVEILNGRLG